jgi:tetratricopeptide (TPR) repeat protein
MAETIQSEPAPHRRSGASENRGALLAAMLPVLACFLGGGTQKWGEGIVVALLGLILLLRPPRFSLGLAANCVFLLFVACAAVAFLPAGWFSNPSWRTILTDDFGIKLPGTVSPQPWLSATCLISLTAGVSWLYFVSTTNLELRGVRMQLRFFVTGIVLIATLSIILYLAHSPMPFWINQRNFGPFPNRNQTADLFGITALVLLACGQDDLRHHRKRWMLWLIGLGILTTAIILNLSRAGIAILVGGSALWIATVALRQRSGARIAVGFSFLLLLLSAILLLGGQTLERFHLHGLGGTGLAADFRWKIFADAFQMIHSSPWCGVGLGNFEAIFAIFRKASMTETRALHPESDWIWMWSEMGWPAVLLTIAGAAILIRHVWPLQEGTNQRFRLAALLGALIFAIHGIVDVSAHRVGTAYAGLFLLGAALHRPLQFKPSVTAPIIFRLLGVGFLAAGLSWTVATKNESLLPGGVGVTVVKSLSPIALQNHDFNEAVSLTTRALEWAPLDWQLYFSRALGEVAQKQPANALADFRRARFLEPGSFEIPFAEGSAWLSSQPVLAATAWREALRRATTGRQRLEVYGNMFSKAAVENPEVGKILQEVGLSQHDLVLAYLSRVNGPRFDQALKSFLKSDPDLHTVTEGEKFALFSLWAERGDLEELSHDVATYPKWMPFAWFGVAKYDASKNDFKTACGLIEEYGDAVAMPRLNGDGSIEELQKRYYSNPDNYAAGYSLYREQMKKGRVDDALLTARHFTERSSAPAYFHVLEARAWAEKQNWERGWKAWLAYRDAIKR